ncbi:MAG: M1 family peptidase, partial [Bacteroidetes bacterium]
FYAQLSEEQRRRLGPEAYFYELTFENVGGLVMPIILEFTLADGSTKVERLPAEIWRRNDERVKKVFVFEQEVVQILLDPFKETADIDLGNNLWPVKKGESPFEKFKRKKSSPKHD